MNKCLAIGRMVCGVLLCWLLAMGSAQAGWLVDRVDAFPHWDSKPLTQPASGDLKYPDWLAGTWTMTSTLVDQVAPLAPAVVTPGFAGNQQFLHQPIVCQVRFVHASTLPSRQKPLFLLPLKGLVNDPVVADRAFNGLNLSKAYLGDIVLAVTVDPRSPNRQMTLMEGGRQLISVITARAVEAPAPDRFVTTELFQQIFRGIPTPYLNQVETTTVYQHNPASEVTATLADRTTGTGATDTVIADQITAIYLSPQDPDYFKAGDRPVALYRYRLELVKDAAA